MTDEVVLPPYLSMAWHESLPLPRADLLVHRHDHAGLDLVAAGVARDRTKVGRWWQGARGQCQGPEDSTDSRREGWWLEPPLGRPPHLHAPHALIHWYKLPSDVPSARQGALLQHERPCGQGSYAGYG